MSRNILSLVAVAGFATVLLAAILKIPAFGAPLGPLAAYYAAMTMPEIHITNVVTAISFDFRAFDTMIEEFIFFASITSVSMILRNTLETNDEDDAANKGKRTVERSDAVNLVGIVWVGLIVALAVSLIAHSHLTPGGGFQAGAILGTALLTVYLVTSREAFERFSPDILVKVADSGGAGLFVAIGACGLIFGTAFMQNVIPRGETGNLFSGGTIVLLNVATALEVSAGYALLFKEYLREVFEADEEEDGASSEG